MAFICHCFLFNATKCGQEELKHYIQRKWKAYMIPYFALCLCNLVATLFIKYLVHIRGMELLYAALRHSFYILYSFGDASKMPSCSPLWFLPCLFISDIYLYIFLRLSKVKKGVMLLTGIIAFAWLVNNDITQLPWHFDIAFLGMIFMYMGLILQRYAILEKIKIMHQLVILCCGGVLILQNTRVDMLSRQFCNPLLFFIGSTCLVIVCMSVFYKQKGVKLLSWIGRNSMFFMGFNLLVNGCMYAVEKRIGLGGLMPYEWLLNFVINVLVISLLVLLWKIFKKKTAEYRTNSCL